MGPMAQDFHAAFNLGEDEKAHHPRSTSTGVALAAIQGLHEKMERDETRSIKQRKHRARGQERRDGTCA
jgi:hypothetical protein